MINLNLIKKYELPIEIGMISIMMIVYAKPTPLAAYGLSR